MSAAGEKDLSIIIPVYNAMDVLPKCIDSILAQTVDLSRVEVLLIDDGSTDGSDSLCDGYVIQYPELFRAFHRQNSGGPAAPRNRGIEEACGKYVFFCDNDDYFGPEAVERMLTHAFEWDSDVLLVKMGETGREGCPHSMFKESAARVDLHSSKVLKTLGPWKAYRRSIIVENTIRFPEDCSFDDSVFTLKMYLRAKTISVAADYDYYFWTIRDDGGNLSSQGGSSASVWCDVSSRNAGCVKMLDLIEANVPNEKRAPFYDKVLGELAYNTLNLASADDSDQSVSNLGIMQTFLSIYASRGCLDNLSLSKRAVFSCVMDGNAPACVRTVKSAPPSSLDDFDKISGVYRCAYAREADVHCHGCHKLFKKTIRRKGNKKRIVSLIKRLAKDFSLGIYFPLAYRRAAKETVLPSKVVFLENKAGKLSDAYTVLYDKLIAETTFDVRFVSLGQNRVRLRRYYYNCRGLVKEVATAKYVFLNDASDVMSCLPLRDETKVVQLWHACGAFKKWGMSTAELKFGGTQKDLKRHPFYENLSLVTVSSPEVAWAYIEAMVLEDRPEIVKALGVSRTDVFFDEDNLTRARERVDKLIPLAFGKRIILYAPTFRGRVASAEGPDELDIGKFQEAFGQDSVLLIKHHPFVKKPHVIPDGCEDFAFDVSGDLDISDLLCVADVCISDYSSLVFEYSLFDRPMIFFAYDIDDYSDWRGFYYNYEELTPGPVFFDNDQMIDYLEHLEERFDVSKVELFREKFMSSCDGHATERICEEVFGEALETYHKPTAYEELCAADPDGIDVSIVIPAYNALPEFTNTLESLIRQTYDLSRVEVIIIDDCSSDGTWDEACRFAQTYPDLFVIDRLGAPSGSPAKPRNAGLEKARGTYVFFLDADDWLGDQAIEKMLDHAVEWNSDVLLVKMKGEHGREVPKSMFAHNQPSADPLLSKVMWSFAPLKLFRRSLIEHLYFPDCMPEDIPFVLRAYCQANTVSVAADYDYYHVSQHEEERHISLTTWNNIDSNLRAYEDIFDFVETDVPADTRDEVLMRRLFRRDIYNSLLSAAQEDVGIGESHARSLVDLARPYYKEAMYRTCPIPKRLVLDSAFFGTYSLLTRVVSEGEGLANRCSYDEIGGRIVCSIPESVGSLSCDVSDAVSLGCKVEHACERDGALELRGTISIPESFTAAECFLVLEKMEHGERIEFSMRPLELGEHVETESGIPSVSASWKVALPFARLFDLDAKWQLSLLCRLRGWEKEARLGPVRSVGVKGSFSLIAAKRGSARLSAFLGPRGDMQVRIRKEL